MKFYFILFSVIITIQSCVSLKDAHCYEVEKSKIVAYKMTSEAQELFGEKKKFKFYDKNDNLFFETYSNKQPNCVPCDSSFLGITEDSLKTEVDRGVNIQIGSGNEIKK